MHRKSEKPNLGKGRNQGSPEVPGSRNRKILSVVYFLRGQSAPPGWNENFFGQSWIIYPLRDRRRGQAP